MPGKRAKAKKSAAEWEAVFRAADTDGSGTLDEREFRTMLRKVNCNISDSQIAQSFVYLDGAFGDRRITLQEFTKGMQQLDEFIIKLGELFNQCDTDNSGFLEKDEIRNILQMSEHKYTEDEIDEIVRKADKSGDGKISFDEFFEACT